MIYSSSMYIDKAYNALKYKSKTMNTEKPIKEVILYRGESVACINQCK